MFLIHDVARLYRRRLDQRAQALGLTSAQWRVLATIARTEFLNLEPLNQATLADQMDMEAITLSRHIDRMETAGLIERRANPTDRRAYQLFLTEAARPLVGSFRTISAGCLADVLVGVSEDDIKLVTDVLNRIHLNIVDLPDTAVAEKPAARPSILKQGEVA
jgi:DNA-binding MarR family transcriptional regulator